MPDTQQSSFIPKRGPVRQIKRASTRQVYLITVLSYVSVFAALFAAAGVFIFSQIVSKQLQEEIIAFNTAAKSFNEADLFRLVDLESRLLQTNFILAQQYSMPGVLEALEKSMLRSVRAESLNISLESDEVANSNSPTTEVAPAVFLADATFRTDTLDSVIFQRDTYGGVSDIEATVVEELTPAFANVESTAQSAAERVNQNERVSVSFALTLAPQSFLSDVAKATAASVNVLSELRIASPVPTVLPPVVQNEIVIPPDTN